MEGMMEVKMSKKCQKKTDDRKQALQEKPMNDGTASGVRKHQESFKVAIFSFRSF